ncbi:SigB/SigF/SigG family RNA polymerase sigma factor [Nocardia sp. SYP-A9097]|uniref:SigB/SigF/SigG family RNA polymerase sigma factor n=1 Tax=Nocardia sp. SYP-A9097 TaxID=2663237 RepID=UPI00129AE5FC|nr:SigB/SigF/SigG family RNA polymerase sigma factor [Nocardia sp. SYP-A9097]MRH93398.1 SigB/SigF/SigG family RNA polymerase sigma factor [Nocardia sp. SYP-A9097]
MNDPTTSTSPAKKPRAHRRADSYDNIEPLFVRLAELDVADPHRIVLREEVIRRCLPLAEHIARKFAGRGESLDDVLQSARVGMVVAVDRYNPDFGAPFLAFAVPTIMGEVRRYFRDFAWAVRVPTRLKEIQLSIGVAVDALCQRLGRMPTATEIADELGIDRVLVTRALVARDGYRTYSLDEVIQGDTDYAPISVLESLGVEEPRYRAVEDCLTVQPLIGALAERECRVLVMRYFESQTQTQIAEQLGVSQMQISRVLSRTLNSLREQALRD